MIGLNFMAQFFYWYYDIKPVEEIKQKIQIQQFVNEAGPSTSNTAGLSRDRRQKPLKSALKKETGQYKDKSYPKRVRFSDHQVINTSFSYKTLEQILKENPNISTSPTPNYNNGYNPYSAKTVDEFFKTKTDFKFALSNVGQPVDEDRKFRKGDFSIAEPYQCSNCSDEDHQRRQAWDNYEMDYMGRDGFENIEAKLEKTLAEDQHHPHTYLPFNTGNPYDHIHANVELPYLDPFTKQLAVHPKNVSEVFVPLSWMY